MLRQKISRYATKVKENKVFLSRAFYLSIFHSPMFLSAVTYTWNNQPTNSNWNNPATWTPIGTPAAQDTVQIFNVPAPGTDTGAVNINGANGVCGILELTNSNPSNFIYIQTTDGRSLTFDNGASSAQYNAGPTSTLFSIIGVNVALNSDLAVNNNSSQALAIEGIISGSSLRTITNQGTGSFEIKGTTGSNTFAGNVINSSGTLSLLKQSPLIAIQGALTINGGTVQLNDNGQFAATSTVSMPSGTPVFDINGKTTSFTSLNMAAGSTTLQGGSLTLSGALTLGSSTSLSFGGGSVSTSGALSLNSGAAMSGSGTLTLAGASSVAYNTGAQGASVSPDVNLSGVTKTFAVALGSDATADLSLTGVVSNGALTKTGTGRLLLSGANTYSGGTTISAGTLIAGANNTMPSTGDVAVSGTFNVNSTTQTIGNFSGSGSTTLGSGSLTTTVTAPSTYSGVISGSGGSLTKAGASTLILSGANTYDGGTTISAGTLQAGANGAIPANSDVSVAGVFDVDTTTQSIANLTGSGSTNIAAAGLLTVAPSSDITYPGTITGAGDVSKQGSSQWQLTGNSTGFTGLCTVAAGELKLNGTLGTGGAGDVTVNSGALFSGNATVGGALSSHGTLSPGNSVGTMVVGSLTLHSDSIVDADINDAMQSDIFTVSPGTAAIDGTLNVNFLPGVYTAGLTYTIVNAPAGVTGTFASVTDNSPDFNIQTTYTATMVTLTIVSPGSSLFFNLPLSGNAKSVADNINAISAAGTLTTDPDLNNAVEVLVGQSVDVISDALQRLDPTPYTTIGATTALVSPMLAEFFAGKKRKSCCPSQFGCEEGKWSLWADPFVMLFDQGARGSQDGFDALAGGFAIGAEKGLSKEWKVGVGFAYDHLSIDFDKHRGSSACNDSYLALFADGEGEQWHFACALLGGADAISNERKIQYLSIDSKAHSNYWAGELIGQASGAYFLGPKARQFQFYGTITSDTFFEPAIHEHGAGGLNLKIRSNTSSVLVSQAGVLFKQRKEFATGCWGPDLWVGYVNEAYLTNGKLRSNFVNQVIPFTTVGVHKTQNLVEAGLSMTLLLNRGLSFTGTYFAQVGGKLAAQNGDLRFRWMF